MSHPGGGSWGPRARAQSERWHREGMGPGEARGRWAATEPSPCPSSLPLWKRRELLGRGGGKPPKSYSGVLGRMQGSRPGQAPSARPLTPVHVHLPHLHSSRAPHKHRAGGGLLSGAWRLGGGSMRDGRWGEERRWEGGVEAGRKRGRREESPYG